MQDSELTGMRQEDSALVQETFDNLKGMQAIISIVNSLTRHMHIFNSLVKCVTAVMCYVALLKQRGKLRFISFFIFLSCLSSIFIFTL